MKTLLMLIGLPGSGKTTFRDKYLDDIISYTPVVISQDDLVDAYAEERGLTYSEAFKQAPLKAFAKTVRANFIASIDRKESIMLDRTNLSRKSRAEFLNLVTGDYKKIAIVFTIHPIVLEDRLERRGKATGKVIPHFVIANMRKSFEAPTSAEFDHIIPVVGEPPTIPMYLRHAKRVVIRRMRRFFKSSDK
jgi:predicted kinase